MVAQPHKNAHNYKAVIIGAGIGGLCAALALQQRGFIVEVYERAAELREVGAGISLWPNAIKALDQLGVGETVRAAGTREANGGIHRRDGRTLLALNAQDAEARFGAPVVAIHRADLTRILAAAFTGTLHLGKNFTGCEERGSAITAGFNDGSEASADILIAADGIHSVLRRHWFPDSRPRYAGYTAWRGIVPFDHSLVGPRWGEFLGCGTRFGVVPMRGERVYWFASQNLPEGTQIAPAARHDHLLALFGNWAAPIPALIRATPPDIILQNDIYDLDPLPEWVRGRAALLGDAAHAMTPNLGQGGCQAIEDAVVLGKCLAAASSLDAGLRAYEQQRMPRANQVAQQSRRLGLAITQSNPLICALRNFVLRLMPPQVPLRGMDAVMGYEV